MATAAALRQHIQEALARGAQRKDIQALLLRAGWTKEIVDEYIGVAAETPRSSPGLIRLRDVTKRFGDTVVLDRITLDIPPGELFGIIGLSGVGKTTLLNTLVGFLEPDSGEIAVQLADGKEASVLRERELVKRMFGFAAQRPSFYPQLSVRENIEHFAALYNLDQGERITRCDKLLRLVGLERAQHTLAQNLSGGMQKRLDIACALVHSPSVLILDEPTADLDNIIRDQIWELLRGINAQGTTVIVASHVVSELEQYCNRIAILRDQRITEVGTTAQLRDIYSKQYEITLRTAGKNYASLRAFCGKKKGLYPKLSQEGGGFTVQTAQPREALSQLLLFLAKSNETVTHVNVDRPSIAKVFELLVKHETHPLH
jgi:ABC-2 type transport system ATP-binding protein